MKKKLLAIIILCILIAAVFICLKPANPTTPPSDTQNSDVNHLEYNHSSDYVYSGFSDIADNYTVNDAIADKCFVIETSNISGSSSKVTGAEYWQEFLDKSSKNENVFLRVVHFIGSDYVAFSDLYYSDGNYYFYEKNEFGIHKTGPNKYLRKLEGTDGIPPKASCYYVLTDSLKLTFGDVRHSHYSSNLDTVTKIPYKWLLFTVYLP